MVKELAKSILTPPYKYLFNSLESIERHLIERDQKTLFSPLFIIGIPRSGTTLLYQLFTSCFKVCYLCNLIESYSTFPCVLSYILSKIMGCTPPRNFKSSYGQVTGWRAPSQGWTFWNRWFPGEDQGYVQLDEVTCQSAKKLRNTILLLEKIYKKPFVNKALSLGTRILPLNRAFPEALFVRMHRSHLDIAQSILKGRKEYMGDKNRWISVKPYEYNKIKDKDYITQICGQIYYLEKDMNRDIKTIGEARCLDVQYNDICNKPKEVLQDIEQFYNRNTCNGKLQKRREPPSFFPVSQGKKCDDDEYRKLKECLENFFQSAQ